MQILDVKKEVNTFVLEIVFLVPYQKKVRDLFFLVWCGNSWSLRVWLIMKLEFQFKDKSSADLRANQLVMV